MSLRDPALAGIKHQKIAPDEWIVKCKARCNGPHGRPKGRLASLSEVHDWALEHRRMFPEHDRNWQMMSTSDAPDQRRI